MADDGKPKDPGTKRPDLNTLQSRLAALRSGLARSEQQQQAEPPTVVSAAPTVDPTPLPTPIADESSLGVAGPMLRAPGMAPPREPRGTGPQPPPPGPRRTLLGVPALVPPVPGGRAEPPEPPRLPGISTGAPPRRPDTVSLPGTPKTPPEDDASTQRVERFDASDVLESTPPPLPPSPAAHSADEFFAEAPTRPAAISDIAPSLGGTSPGTGPRLPSERRFTGEEETYRAPGVSRGMVALAAAAAFAVGTVLGAIVFRDRGTPPSAPPPTVAAAPAAVPCVQPAPPPVEEKAAVAPIAPAAAPDAAVAVAPPPPAGGCALRVASEPEGADVVVDGKEAGKTPLELTDLPCGEVTVKLARSRYQGFQKKLTLTAGAPGEVSADLRRATSKVTIVSTPSGAKVYLGGKPVGATPLTRELTAFTRHKVQLVSPGFQTATVTVYPKDRTTRVTVPLVKGARRR